jgi:flagellar basal body rod protein FlgB
MSSLVSAPVFGVLSRALDVAALEQAVHTANIANAGVPGYHRLEVSFDAQVQRAADETVRLDKEMALMAKDAARYQTLLSAFDRTVGLLQMAIKEGREG